MNNQIKNRAQYIFVFVLFFILAFVRGMDVVPLELSGTENAPQTRTLQSSSASDKFVVRSRVLSNTTSSMSAQSNTPTPQKVIQVVAENEVLVTYFNDAVYSIILDSEISGYAGNRVYSGKIKGEPFLTVVAVLGEKGDIYLTMDNISTGKSYTLASEVARNIVIQEINHHSKKAHMYTKTLAIDTAKSPASQNPVFPFDDDVLPESLPPIQFSSRAPCDGSTIDVMVVYDTTAQTKKGTQMNSFAESSVQKMNLALRNSGITEFTMRLVHVEAVNITHTHTLASMSNILKSLAEPTLTTGVYGAIKQLRNTYGADLVTCFVDHQANDGLGGLGYSLRETFKSWFADNAYNVVDVDAASSGHTYTHELGHNMGAGHSRTQASQRGPQFYVTNPEPSSSTDYPDDYSAGYQNAAQWAYTIMAYNFDGPGGGDWGNIYNLELPVFSAPGNYTYNGTSYTIGATNAHNTRIIKEQWGFVSNFRTSTNPGGTPTESTNLCAGRLLPSLTVWVTSDGVKSVYSFLKKPSLRFEYKDPYSSKTKKISLKLYNFQKGVTSISSWVNSSPQLFDKRLYNRNKRYNYTSSFISSSGAFYQSYSANLTAKLNDKKITNGRVYQSTGLSYSFVNPAISQIQATSNPFIYALYGMNFGRANPKVWIEYKQKGKIKRQSLRVSGAFEKDRITKSRVMKSSTGESLVWIKFPKKWMYSSKRPVSEDGRYELVLSNGKGMAVFSISFQ